MSLYINFNSYMMFPLYHNDGLAREELTGYQTEALGKLLNSIEKGDLRLVKKDCLCNNQSSEKDLIIALKDRYGIPVSNILCCKCGLIRSGEIFDEESNILFYKMYYRDIYVGQHNPDDNFFHEQTLKGDLLLAFLERQQVLSEILNVAEIGCGAGGILFPFYKKEKICKGFDYNNEYLSLGRKFGLNLISGDYHDYLEDNSTDLLILSHVMEHFTDPVTEIQNITKKIAFGKYLVVVVPGVFNVHKIYGTPLLYLQNAHVFNFNYYWLKIFFETLGLEIVYGDEYCTFLLRKPPDWVEQKVSIIWDDKMGEFPQRIKRYLLKTHLKSSIVRRIGKLLDFFGLKKIIRRVIK